MKKLTVEQLKQLLIEGKQVKGSTFAGICTSTVPTLKGGKGNPMKDRVNKITEGALVMLFSNKTTNAYENMVNRRKVATQGADVEPFKVGNRVWGERIPNTPVVVHTKKGADKPSYYLETIHCQSAETLLDSAKEMGIEFSSDDSELIEAMKNKVVGYKSKNGATRYELDGESIDKSEVVGLDQNKEEGKQGGLSKKAKVIIRTYALASIMRITIGGETYIIEN